MDTLNEGLYMTIFVYVDTIDTRHIIIYIYIYIYISSIAMSDSLDPSLRTSTLQIDASRIRPSLVAYGLRATSNASAYDLTLEQSKTYSSVTLKANISEAWT